MNNSVSARRMRSPLVGPNISAYALRGMLAISSLSRWSVLQVAHHCAIETIDLAFARQRHQFHRALLARFEAHGRAGRDIEAHAVGAPALEGQRRIDFKKVKVRAHLD